MGTLHCKFIRLLIGTLLQYACAAIAHQTNAQNKDALGNRQYCGYRLRHLNDRDFPLRFQVALNDSINLNAIIMDESQR
jgi:hypothetical protein